MLISFCLGELKLITYFELQIFELQILTYIFLPCFFLLLNFLSIKSIRKHLNFSILVAKINRLTSLTFSKLTCCAYLICKRTELIFIILAF